MAKLEIFVQSAEEYKVACYRAEQIKNKILKQTDDLKEIAGILNVLVESFEKSFNCKLINR